MAKAKSELFDADLRESADLFKAMAHPARLAILKYLADRQVCISGDISEELPLGRTTVNQHLAELKNKGLIQGEISGSRVCYCLDNKKIEGLKNSLDKFLTSLECCGITDSNCC